jgi:hypothetical protein
MPSLSSFVNSSQYIKENLTFPFVAGMRLGTGYAGVSFAGFNGATNKDPGGLFGWLIYARTSLANPPKGLTTDTYLVYNNPYDLVGDLNLLTGVTSCLISATGAGGTFGFFTNIDGINITAKEIGNQFLHAINYLAYGGTLVIAGQASGLGEYVTDNNNYMDLLVDRNHDFSIAQLLIDQPYTLGVFPSIPGSDGITGSGYTMANFASLFGNTSFVSGIVVANRVFNVRGLKTITDLDVSTLQANSKITYTISNVNDVAGFFARSKSRNESYLSVAGLDRSTVINGNVIDPIAWESSLRNLLRTNKVNFFVNYNPKFLGSDYVGATASTAAITADDRVGPSRMRADLTKAINQIGLKHIFDINNQTTRDQVISEVQTALDPFAPYLDTTKTQIICNSVNNDENSSTLNIEVVVKPILSIDNMLISLSYTQ